MKHIDLKLYVINYLNEFLCADIIPVTPLFLSDWFYITSIIQKLNGKH